MNNLMKNKIVLDIETTGLNPWYGDKITCICAKKIGSEERFRSCISNEGNLLLDFITWLNKYEIKETILITANGKQFDIPFLLSRIAQHNDFLHVQQINLRTPYLFQWAIFDLLNDITTSRISLDNLARIYGIPASERKSATGLQAIEWFRQKKFKEIEAYCWNDVLLTEKVFKIYEKLKTEGQKDV